MEAFLSQRKVPNQVVSSSAAQDDSVANLRAQLSKSNSGDSSQTAEGQLLDIFDALVADMTAVSQQVENELNMFQEQASIADSMLLEDLGDHSAKLDDVQTAVNEVATNFEKASEGAVKIGERLTVAHNERKRVESAIDLMNYIEYLETVSTADFDNIHSFGESHIRKLLPPDLRNKDWGIISVALHDLRRILLEINSQDVQNAQKHVIKLTEAIEAELLQMFDVAINDLMTTRQDAKKESLVRSCRSLAQWLHYFNSGQAVQKRYIFSVVEKRIPMNIGGEKHQATSVNAWKMLASVMKKTKDKLGRGGGRFAFGDDGGDDDDGDDSSAGGDSDDMSEDYNGEVEEKEEEEDNNHRNKNAEEEVIPSKALNDQQNQAGASDQLSALFGTIGTVCQEQFAVIRLIFPSYAIAKVTRMLVQRIFNDPAFGIQARVDNVLMPKPPKPQLSLSDYLDALNIVREKLSALYMILLEYCTHPALRGIGKESGSMSPYDDDSRRRRSSVVPIVGHRRRGMTTVSGDGSRGTTAEDMDNNNNNNTNNQPFIDEDDERIKSDAEVKEFLEEQIIQVLSSYMADYFEKENYYLRQRYVEDLRRFADDSSMSRVSSGTVVQTLPKLKAEKMKSIPNIAKSVGNMSYINSVFHATTDSVLRMIVIGKEDKRLPTKLKELYLLQMGFLVEGVFLPWSQACTIMLLKLATNKSTSNPVLPPVEFLSLLATVYNGMNRLKTHFDDTFLRYIDQQNHANIIAICKEARRRAVKVLDKVSREALHAWTLCVGFYVDKTLSNLQTKSDYGNSNMLTSGTKSATIVEPTVACNTVCKSLLTVANTVRAHQTDLAVINVSEHIWKPLGRLVIGALISHLRRQKITMDGAKYTLRDLEEYTNIMMLYEAPENMDLMMCLKEIALVLRASPADVPKVVVEGLRHLDTNVVLAIVKARADSNVKNPDHWVRKLSSMYNNSKWDAPLPWELKRNMTVVTFAESAAAGASSQALGPVTLRKSSMAVSTSVMSEIAKNLLPGTNNSNNSSSSMAGLMNSLVDNNSDLYGSANIMNSNYNGESSSFAPDRPGSLPVAEHDRLMMTPEDIQEADARAASARQQAEMDAIAANPALQIKNLINTKLTQVSQGIADNSSVTSSNVQKGIDAMKGSAANLVSGMKQGLQKGKSNGSPENPFENIKRAMSPATKSAAPAPPSAPASAPAQVPVQVPLTSRRASSTTTTTTTGGAPGNPYASSSSTNTGTSTGAAAGTATKSTAATTGPPPATGTTGSATAAMKDKASEMFGKMSSMFKRN